MPWMPVFVILTILASISLDVNAAAYNLHALLPCDPSTSNATPTIYSVSVQLQRVFLLSCQLVNKDVQFNESQLTLGCDVTCHSLQSSAVTLNAQRVALARPLAVIGSFRAVDTDWILQALPDTAVLSPTTASPSLTRPNFFPLTGLEKDIFQALLYVLTSLNFFQVALIGPQGFLSTESLALLQDGGIEILINLELLSTDPQEVHQALDSIKASGASVIFVMLPPDDYQTVIQHAADLDMTGAQGAGTYIWLSTAAVFSQAYVQANPQLQQALQGSLDFRPSSGNGSTWDALLAAWEAESNSLGPLSAIPFAAEMLDAVYAVAQTAHRMKLMGLPVSHTTLLPMLRTTSFVGATGAVSFDALSVGRKTRPAIAIANCVLWRWTQVGSWAYDGAHLQLGNILWPGGSISVPAPRQVVRLAAILPCDSSLASTDISNYLTGVEMCSAFKLACEDLETHLTFAPLYKVQCTLLPSNFSIPYLRSLVIANMHKVIGFVGDRTATSCIEMQRILGPWGIPQIGLSSAAELSDTVQYPSYYRTVPSDSFQAFAIVDVVNYFGWPRVGIIGVDSAYSRGILQSVTQILGTKVAGYAKIPENGHNSTLVTGALESLRSTGARVFLVAGVGDDCLTIMTTAADLGMTGARWTWLATAGCTAQPRSVMLGAAGQAMQGLLGIAQGDGTGPLFQMLAARWAALDPEQFPGQVHQGLPPGSRVGVTYDAVYAFANALHVLRTMGHPRQFMDRARLLEALQQVNFNGTTGTVSFDSKGDRSRAAYTIVNLRGVTFEPVGTWTDTTHLSWDTAKKVMWPGGSLIPPSGRPHVTVTIGALLPVDPSLATNSSHLLQLGLQVQSAFLIACRDVNEGLLAPLEVTLRCITRSTQDNPVNALRVAASATSALVQEGAIAVVGALRSEQSMAAHAAAQDAGIPLISPQSSSVILANKTLYPNFFRTHSGDAVQAQALAALWAHFHWDHVAILATDDAYAAGLAQLLKVELVSLNVSVLLDLRYEIYANEPPLQQMQTIRDSLATVVFISCVSTDCYWALQAAKSLRMTPAKYQIIATNGMALLDGTWGNHSDLALWAQGMVGTAPLGGSTPLWDLVKAKWAGLDKTEFPGPGPSCAEAYDAVLAIAHAIARIPEGQSINGSALMAEFRKSDFRFNGTTGIIGFNANQDPIEAGYVMWNLRDAEIRQVGTFDTKYGLALSGTPILWSGMSTVPPLGKKLRYFTLAGLFATHPNNPSPNHEAEAAFRIACEDANAAVDLLSAAGVRLRCRTYPTFGLVSGPSNLTNVPLMVAQAVNEGADGLIGVEEAVNCMEVQRSLVSYNISIPHISHAATSRYLSNRTQFPTFYRTTPSDGQQAQALAAVITYYFPLCKQVGLLFTQDPYGQGLAEAFRVQAVHVGIRVVIDRGFPPNCISEKGCSITSIMSPLRRSGVTVFLLMAVTQDAVILLKEAGRLQLVGDGYVWLGPDGISAAGINSAQETQLFQGFLTVMPRGGYGPTWDNLLTQWGQRDPVVYPSGIALTGTLQVTSGYTYDAVMAIARSLDELALSRTSNKSTDLSSPLNVLSALNNVAFTGATGMVAFDQLGNRLDPEFLLVNFQANRFVEVGRWTSQGLIPGSVSIKWPPNRIGTPPDACTARIVRLFGAFPTEGPEVDTSAELMTLTQKAGSGVVSLAQELNSAFHIACDAVNTPGPLVGQLQVRVSCETLPTTGTPEQTVAALDQVLPGYVVAGIVGPIRNTHAAAVAAYLGARKTIQISPAATAVALDNRATYPYAFRTSPSLSTQASTLVNLIASFSWRQVAVLYSDMPDSVDYAQSLAGALKESNVTLLASASFPSGSTGSAVREALKKVKSSKASVIILGISNKDDTSIRDAQIALTAALALDMTGMGWVWILTGAIASAVPVLFKGDGASVQEAMQGAIALVPRMGFGRLYDQLLLDWQQRDQRQYPGQVFQGTRKPQVYVAETFDAVLVYAQALTDLVTRYNVSLDAPDFSERLRDVIASPDFHVEGTTGRISFSDKGDPSDPTFELVNLQADEFVSVGTCDVDGHTQLTRPLVWAGGVLTTPSDSQSSVLVVVRQQLEKWVIVVVVIMVLLLTVCAILITWLVICRQPQRTRLKDGTDRVALRRESHTPHRTHP